MALLSYMTAYTQVSVYSYKKHAMEYINAFKISKLSVSRILASFMLMQVRYMRVKSKTEEITHG